MTTETLPVTHSPHTWGLLLPPEFEAAQVWLPHGLCEHGTCPRKPRNPAVEARWAAAGIGYENRPGIHWWTDSSLHMLNLAYLHRARYECNTADIAKWTEKVLFYINHGYHKEN